MLKADLAALPVVLDALRSHNKLLAVKAYRETTGAGLPEAMQAIDAYLAGMTQSQPPPLELLDLTVRLLAGDAHAEQEATQAHSLARWTDEQHATADGVAAKFLLEANRLCELYRDNAISHAEVIARISAALPELSQTTVGLVFNHTMTDSR